MADDYNQLVTDIGDWLNRADLSAKIPRFIRMAEAQFDRRLRTIEMEGTATATLTGDSVALPADFAGLRSINYGVYALQEVPPQNIDDDTTTGIPSVFAIVDGMFVFRPAPASGTVKIRYYQKLPALTVANPTNWLMTKWPDLYLFAALIQAEFYNWNDSRLPLIKSRVDEIYAEIEESINKERFGGRTLAIASRVANMPGAAI
jgi:hypothetical protein